MPKELTLDPLDWAQLRALGHRMLDDTLNRLENVREEPVWQPMPADLLADFQRPLPRTGTGIEHAYAEFVDKVAPYPLGNTHPRFWGWVIGSGTPFGALAEMVAAGFNANVSGLRSGAVPVEDQVIDWLKELLGYPATASGILTSGGSMANILGVAVGLDATAGFDLAEHGLAAAPKRLVLYASQETHFSIDKAVRLLGLGRSAYRKLPVDARYRIDIQALAAASAADRAAGLQPFLVVGNAGTVSTGACDDLDGLADLCEAEGLWLHVDGAFGAFAATVPELRPLVRGMERADSLGFDLHKWLHVPIEAACLLVRNAEAHRQAFSVRAGCYVSSFERGIAQDLMRFAERGPQLTRGFRALKIWMTLQAYGADLHADLIAQNVAQARRLEAMIAERAELELLAPVDLNIVCYRYRGARTDDSGLDQLNRELLMRLQERGIAAPSSTSLHGRFAIRVCIANHRTRQEDLEVLVEKSIELGGEIEAEPRPR